jgi:hypothetical protein
MGQFIKNGLKLIRRGSEKNYVTGRTVEIEKTTSFFFPNITKFPQNISLVEFARRLINTHGVKVGYVGKKIGSIAVTTDNPTTIPKNTHDTTVLPVTFFVLIRQLKQSQKIIALGFSLGNSLNVSHKAWPWPLRKFIQHRGLVL